MCISRWISANPGPGICGRGIPPHESTLILILSTERLRCYPHEINMRGHLRSTDLVHRNARIASTTRASSSSTLPTMVSTMTPESRERFGCPSPSSSTMRRIPLGRCGGRGTVTLVTNGWPADRVRSGDLRGGSDRSPGAVGLRASGLLWELDAGAAFAAERPPSVERARPQRGQE